MEEVGFAVIYRWKTKKDREQDFVEGWSQLTRALRDNRGALGSRLHRAADGIWVAYAQWPSEEVWRQAFDGDSPDAGAMAIMRDAIEQAMPPMLLTPVRDNLELRPARTEE
jgi:hypothetical protein